MSSVSKDETALLRGNSTRRVLGIVIDNQHGVYAVADLLEDIPDMILLIPRRHYRYPHIEPRWLLKDAGRVRIPNSGICFVKIAASNCGSMRASKMSFLT